MRVFSTLILALLVTTVTTGCQDKSTEVKKNKPNILFILTDDQKHDTFGNQTNGEVITPNIDKLAEQGLSFNNAYILGSPHGAVCSPSRAMLMTGKPFFNLDEKVYAMWEYDKSERGKTDDFTFPEYLKQQGYTTFATGKQHNGRYWLEKGFDQVKAGFLGGMWKHYGVPVQDYNKQDGWSDKYKLPKQFSSELFANSAIDFIEQQNKDNPFLVYLSFTAPHDPRTAPNSYHEEYKTRPITMPKNVMPEHPFPIADMNIRSERNVPFPRTPEIVEKEIRDYYAMVSATDYQIGRVLKQLEESGLADNTIVIFTSDNGLSLGQHGLMAKQTIYEHSVKIPMIIKGPGVPKGAATDAYAYLHDVFPTLVDFTQGDMPKSIESKSLLPIIKGESDSVRDSMFYTYNAWRFESEKYYKTGNPFGSHRAIRQGDFKLIVSNKDDVTTEQLFNLKQDPWELNNLVHLPEFKSKRDQMFVLLKQKMDQHRDPSKRDYKQFGQFKTISSNIKS